MQLLSLLYFINALFKDSTDYTSSDFGNCYLIDTN